jgi:GNAT superfamily N-acetyltransferase
MTIREARYSDLRPAAEVAATAFVEDELFGKLMHPHRREYPQDFVRFFEEYLRIQWFDHTFVILVAIDPPSGKIVGVGKWERQGKGGRRRLFSRLDPRSLHLPILTQLRLTNHLGIGSLIYPLASLFVGVEHWMWPNRAADPSKANVLRDSFDLYSFNWSGPRKENWYLELLAVHPDYQGKGHGGELVQWGVGEAAREGVCASVISADGVEKLYAKFGFAEVGRSNVGPLSMLEGGAIMFNDVKT